MAPAQRAGKPPFKYPNSIYRSPPTFHRIKPTYLITVTTTVIGESLPQMNFPASLKRTSDIWIWKMDPFDEKVYRGSLKLECFLPVTPMIIALPFVNLVQGGGYED